MLTVTTAATTRCFTMRRSALASLSARRNASIPRPICQTLVGSMKKLVFGEIGEIASPAARERADSPATRGSSQAGFQRSTTMSRPNDR
jgi:hypothetical protein